MKNLFSILIVIFFFISVMAQQDMNGGMIYGDDHAFLLQAPAGWVLDNSAGVSQGLHAVFYKKGQSWAKAEIVMYATTEKLQTITYNTLQDFIDADVKHFKKEFKDIVIEDAPAIQITDSIKASVKYFSGITYANYDAIAYINAGKVAVVIALSSRTKEGFEDSKNAFEKLVKSYVFVTDKVEINTK